jgi:hypothetical protein
MSSANNHLSGFSAKTNSRTISPADQMLLDDVLQSFRRSTVMKIVALGGK